jgi:hypothetical protein
MFVIKVFQFFEPSRAHLRSKFEKSNNMTLKNFAFKNQKRYKKNKKIHAYVKSVEKVLKNGTKKSYHQKRDGNMHFSTFAQVVKLVLLITFCFGAFFKDFQQILNQHEILRFYTFLCF